MSVPVSLQIICGNETLCREIEDELQCYLPVETETRQSCAPGASHEEEDDSSGSDNAETTLDLLESPFIIAKIHEFVASDADVTKLGTTCTPPTSPDRDTVTENEDPLSSVVSNSDVGMCVKKCLAQFPVEKITEHRLNMLEMEKDCKDMLIMGQLQACGVSKGLNTRTGERKRHKFSYQYDNIDVCRDCYLYINGIGLKYLKNLKKHMKKAGVVPRTHGNKNRKPKHALTFEDARRVVTFLIGYSDRHGMPQPAARRGRDETPPVYLPRASTYVSVHKDYQQSCQEMDVRILSETTFRRIWHQCVPHITFMEQRTDVCHICEDFQDKVRTNFGTEAERMQLAQELSRHLEEAQQERDFYRDRCKAAADELDGRERLQPPVPPCSQDLYCVHYTFDFANSVLVPSHVRQEGPLYYKSPLKVNWFGICNDGRTMQTNYIYSEAECIGVDGNQGHCSNAVVSLLHHHLSDKSEGERKCNLNADNCGGQNKNQIMTGYLCWRILVGLNEEIYLHFMKPYHARCLVDGMFGLGRKSIRRTDVDCVNDVCTAIEKSTTCAEVIPYSTENQNPSWLWRDWKMFLKPMFKAVPSIQKYQHFRFPSSNPGSVFVRTSSSTPEREIKLLKTGVTVQADMLPPRLEAGGLSPQRSWYLFKNVRPYVHIPHKDTTCPKPSVAQPRSEE